MLINRRFKKSIALTLAAAALAAAMEIAAQPAGARTVTGPVCTTTHERGYPDAVPPILPPPPCSALKLIEREEAFESQEFWYDPPASAPYSDVEMNVFAREGTVKVEARQSHAG
jgi:hypothetical protein